jgi:hypothetical protein
MRLQPTLSPPFPKHSSHLTAMKDAHSTVNKHPGFSLEDRMEYAVAWVGSVIA